MRKTRSQSSPCGAASDALTAAGATVLSTDVDPAVLHIQASRAILEGTVAGLNNAFAVVETPTVRSIFDIYAAADLIQPRLQHDCTNAPLGRPMLPSGHKLHLVLRVRQTLT